jgi:hypothetical protein
MRKETKEIVELQEKWLTTISGINVEYAKAIEKLNKVNTTLKSQIESKFKLYVVGLSPYFAPILILLFTYILIEVLFYTMPCGITTTIGNATITKACPRR